MLMTCEKYGPPYLHDSDFSSEDSFNYEVLQDYEDETVEEPDGAYFSDMNDDKQE